MQFNDFLQMKRNKSLQNGEVRVRSANPVRGGKNPKSRKTGRWVDIQVKKAKHEGPGHNACRMTCLEI